MATSYNNQLSTFQRTIVQAAIGILVTMLTPFRNDVVFSKRLFGFFSISITWGELLDFLTGTFGTAPVTSISSLSAPPAASGPSLTEGGTKVRYPAGTSATIQYGVDATAPGRGFIDGMRVMGPIETTTGRRYQLLTGTGEYVEGPLISDVTNAPAGDGAPYKPLGS